jgi:transcriptional regulator with XRE-family HTH domain
MSIKKNINQKLIHKLETMAGESLTFGTFIRSIRLGEEMNQESFANLLGISKQHMCDIEKGRRFVSPKLAAKYADLLGYSKEQFIRLCLQDILERDGLDLIITIQAA